MGAGSSLGGVSECGFKFMVSLDGDVEWLGPVNREDRSEVKSVYLIGSLRNDSIPLVGNRLRESGYEAFDDWYGAGPEADDKWQEYENLRGRGYKEALAGRAAQTVFHFDKENLDRCDAGVLVLPAGKSGHIEFGYMAGRGKPAYVLFDKVPERYDVMYNFATDIFFSVDELLEGLK